jgi:hypothetical protein
MRGAASVLRGARQRSTQALDATLSRLANAAPPLLDRKGYKVVLVREPLVRASLVRSSRRKRRGSAHNRARLPTVSGDDHDGTDFARA